MFTAEAGQARLHELNLSLGTESECSYSCSKSAGLCREYGYVSTTDRLFMNPAPNLCYTIALDRPGEDVHRRMARLLVTSLIRTGWHGRMVVFRNHPRPVFEEGHRDLQEILLDVAPEKVWHRRVSWKYRVRDRLDLTGIGKVLFLDCDIIALRSINQLMLGTWDIYTAPESGRIVEFPFNGYLTDVEMAGLNERPGLNSGSLGIRAEHFRAVMAEWERIDALEPLRPCKFRNQHSWNRLILDTPLRHRYFADGEVQYPFLHRAVYTDYRQAALIHAADRTPEEKLGFLYGMWMDAFGGDRLDHFTALPGFS